MLWSFFSSSALELFINNRVFFDIDYFEKKHPRSLPKIHESWGTTQVIHRDWRTSQDYFLSELDLIDSVRKYRKNNRKPCTMKDTIVSRQKARQYILENGFFHVTENTKEGTLIDDFGTNSARMYRYKNDVLVKMLKNDNLLFSELKNLEKRSRKEKEEGLLVVFDKILEQIRPIHLADFKEALGDKNVNDLKIFFDDLVEKLLTKRIQKRSSLTISFVQI